MKYTLKTKIRFAVALGREVEEEISTLEELGFTQEDLNSQSEEELEKAIQEMYEDWEGNYLDSGWAAIEN